MTVTNKDVTYHTAPEFKLLRSARKQLSVIMAVLLQVIGRNDVELAALQQ